MRGGQETWKAFENVNTFPPKLVVKQAAKREVRREAEIKNARESFNAAWNREFLKQRVELGDHCSRFCREVLLQRRPFRPEMREDRLYRSKRERVTHKGPGKESDAHCGIGVIAKLPRAAVQSVHEL